MRYGYQVDLTRHQAITQNAHPCLTAAVPQQRQVNFAIGLAAEDGLSFCPAWHHVVRDSEQYVSSQPWNLTNAVNSKDEFSQFFAWDGSGCPTLWGKALRIRNPRFPAAIAGLPFRSPTANQMTFTTMLSHRTVWLARHRMWKAAILKTIAAQSRPRFGPTTASHKGLSGQSILTRH